MVLLNQDILHLKSKYVKSVLDGSWTAPDVTDS